MKTPKVHIIAGSDSGGGAGIQADIKTVTSLGGFATTAITAITAQNTLGVQQVECLSPGIVAAQTSSVLDDMGTDAVKIGMLPTKDIIAAVARGIHNLSCPIVIDPVMVSTTGTKLIDEMAVAALSDFIRVQQAIVTPNLHEAEILLGRTIRNVAEMHLAVVALQKKYRCSFLLKGGHLENNKGYDVFIDQAGVVTPFQTREVKTDNNHGTGCTLSSAIAFHLANQLSAAEAIRAAKEYLHKALSYGHIYQIGKGSGPVCHNYMLKTLMEQIEL